MTRRPRKPDEHLVSARLLCHAYGQMGEIATAGGFFTYFVVMRLYGFYPGQLFGLVNMATANPYSWINGQLQSNANYNIPYTFDIGNAVNFGCPALLTPCTRAPVTNIGFPNWLATTNANVDLRAFFSTCDDDTGLYRQVFQWPTDVLGSISPISGLPVAFTVESLFYAQSAYFVTVVMVQWSNVFACKSRKVIFI